MLGNKSKGYLLHQCRQLTAAMIRRTKRRQKVRQLLLLLLAPVVELPTTNKTVVELKYLKINLKLILTCRMTVVIKQLPQYQVSF